MRVGVQLRLQQTAEGVDRSGERARVAPLSPTRRHGLRRGRDRRRAQIVRRGACPPLDDRAVRVVRRPGGLTAVQEREDEQVARSALRRQAEHELRQRRAVEVRERRRLLHGLKALLCLQVLQ